jgi:hypothetical protein
LRGDGVWDGYRVGGGCEGVFGVGGGPHVDYAGSWGQVCGRVGAYGDDGAGGFAAEGVGVGGGRVEAGAEVAVVAVSVCDLLQFGGLGKIGEIMLEVDTCRMDRYSRIDIVYSNVLVLD